MGVTRENCDWVVRAFYGPLAEPPKRSGDLAFETIHLGDQSKDMEVAAANRRFDIGHVDVYRGPWRQR